MKLYDLKIGERAEIEKIAVDKTVLSRLRALDFYEGAKIRLLKKAFWGRTLLIDANGTKVGIRKSLALAVSVKRVAEISDGETL